ncbi:putative tolerance protein to group A colicin, single-stranded filamentous DNA phage, required for OM integrity [Acinetobacter sp. 25977_6]|nr:putative tolerance protein to group A colicin, single-stranded filamentous DNA phage, required for OM integrity [Acinetobacter sp. 25977_6]
MRKPKSRKRLKRLSIKLKLMRRPKSRKRLKRLSVKLRLMQKPNSKKRLKRLSIKLKLTRRLKSRKRLKRLSVKLKLMRKRNSKKRLKRLSVKLRLRQKKKLHLPKKHRKKLHRKRVKPKKLHLQRSVILNRKFEMLGISQQEHRVRKQLRVSLSAIVELYYQLLLALATQMLKRVLKLRFVLLHLTQCHPILMLDVKQGHSVQHLLQNKYIVTCFK